MANEPDGLRRVVRWAVAIVGDAGLRCARRASLATPDRFAT